MPTYNRAKYIKESVLSVLSQSYRNLELIVIDDGSTDDTVEILNSIEDPRLITLIAGKHGRSAARNIGIGLARGELLAFLDSDDIFYKDKLRQQVDFMKSNPGCCLTYTSADCIDQNGTKIDYLFEAELSGLIYTKIALYVPQTIILPTVMTYTKIIKKIGGFDSNLDRFEDTDLWRRISKEYRIDAMPSVLTSVRTHPENSLRSLNQDQIINEIDNYVEKVLREDFEQYGPLVYALSIDLYRHYMQAVKYTFDGEILHNLLRKYRKRISNLSQDMDKKINQTNRRQKELRMKQNILSMLNSSKTGRLILMILVKAKKTLW